MDALTRSVISHVKKLSEVNPFFTEEMRLAMINAPGPGTVADLVAFALTLPKAEAQEFFETQSVKSRFEKLLVLLKREQDVADLQKKITEDVNSKINGLQRILFEGAAQDDQARAGCGRGRKREVHPHFP